MGFIGKDECDKCHGKGYLNNEEWFNELSTETKARIMHLVYMAGYSDGFKGAETIPLRDINEWLKQPHKQRGD
jgi:hypothetical protein